MNLRDSIWPDGCAADLVNENLWGLHPFTDWAWCCPEWDYDAPVVGPLTDEHVWQPSTN